MLRSTILCATLLAVLATAGGKCGPVICSPGQVCCNDQYCMDLWSGGSCTEKAKNKAEAAVKAAGERCGPYVCGAGQICCDDTYCMTVWSGGTCNETKNLAAKVVAAAAELKKAVGGKCGPVICSPGQVCCDDQYCMDLWSGGSCTEKAKKAAEVAVKAAGERCGPYVCGAGQICCDDTYCMTVWSGGTCTEAAKKAKAAAAAVVVAPTPCATRKCNAASKCCATDLGADYCAPMWDRCVARTP